MRPLTKAQPAWISDADLSECVAKAPKNRGHYERQLARLKAAHHGNCLFNRQPAIVPGLRFSFDDGGVLHGQFCCNGFHQSYDGIVHGGVIAAIVDAAMVQCLMGHGVVGYTTELSIKYRKPVAIRTPATLTVRKGEIRLGCLYTMTCEITQSHNLVTQATARFYEAAL